MLFACIVAMIGSTAALVVLQRVAKTLGLVDSPDHQRKRHVGKVPLIGGLAIFFGLISGAFVYGQYDVFIVTLLALSSALVLLGALDDRQNLSVRVRVMFQVLLILFTVAVTGVHIHTLGNIFGHELTLGWMGIPLTVVAVIGLLNAFNMIDGIDGLAGGLALVAISAIMVFTGLNPGESAILLLALLFASVVPYMLFNLGLIGRKAFLGDAGSMLIGYLLAWVLIRMSQLPQTHFSPVNVLWCVALPVLDTAAVVCQRLQRRASPFKPDRRHIHHLLLQYGLSQRATLAVLIALACTMAFVGTVARSLSPGSGPNVLTFLTVAAIYLSCTTRFWALQEAKQKVAEGNHAGVLFESPATNSVFEVALVADAPVAFEPIRNRA